MRKGTCVIVGALVLVLAGCGGKSNKVTVDLVTQNGSGESGTATLTKAGAKTKVVIDLQNAPAGAQPTHIHKGSCAKLDAAPQYGLTNVQSGKSTTTVNASLDDLRKGAFAINVHKSAADLKTYVACGDIGSGKSGGGSGYKY